jgi:hypothetical protein
MFVTPIPWCNVDLCQLCDDGLALAAIFGACLVWSGLFAVNMIMKEASMSRYPEWQAYRARTGWLLPKLF